MNLQRCSKGHFFDSEKFSSCPYCHKNIEKPEIRINIPNTVNIYRDIQDDDRTELLAEENDDRTELLFDDIHNSSMPDSRTEHLFDNTQGNPAKQSKSFFDILPETNQSNSARAISSPDVDKNICGVRNEIYNTKPRPKSHKLLYGGIALVTLLVIAIGVFLVVRYMKKTNLLSEDSTISAEESGLTDDVVIDETVTDNLPEDDKTEEIKLYTEDELLKFIEIAANHKVDKYLSADFNNDGENDIVAEYKDYEDRNIDISGGGLEHINIWYADQNRVTKVRELEGSLTDCRIEDGDDSKKAVFEYVPLYQENEVYNAEFSVINDIPGVSYPDDFYKTKLEVLHTEDQTKSLTQSTEEELVNSLQSAGAANLQEVRYDDYNGDGINEVFAYTQEKDEETIDDGISIWFADSRGAMKVLDKKDNWWFDSNIDTLQFGKQKQYEVSYASGTANDSYSCSFGYINDYIYMIDGITPFTIEGSKTYSNEPVTNKYSFGDANRNYDEWNDNYEVTFIGGQYYEYASCRISEEMMRYYKNYSEINEKIEDDFKTRAFLTNNASYYEWKSKSSKGKIEEWDYVVPNKILYCADGNVYIVFECWDSKENKDSTDKLIDELDDPWQYFFDNAMTDLPSAHSYFYYAKLKTNEDALEYEGLYVGNRMERGGFMPYYPNMFQLVKDLDYTIIAEQNDRVEEENETEKANIEQQPAKSEEELRQIAAQYGDVDLWAYNDYDGDGRKEAWFVTYHEYEWDKCLDNVYYVNSNGDVTTFSPRGMAGMYIVNDNSYVSHANKGFFFVSCTAGGSGGSTLLYGVRNDEPYELDISENLFEVYEENGEVYTYERGEYAGDSISVRLIYNPDTQQFTKEN